MTTSINYLAIAAAAVAAFLQGGLWYSPVMFGNIYAGLLTASGKPLSPVPMHLSMAGEAIRCVVLAVCLATLMSWLRVSSLLGVLQLVLVLWVGFQAIALAGSVVHEGYDWRLYALHTSDALVKTLLIACVIYFWPWQKAVA